MASYANERTRDNNDRYYAGQDRRRYDLRVLRKALADHIDDLRAQGHDVRDLPTRSQIESYSPAEIARINSQVEQRTAARNPDAPQPGSAVPAPAPSVEGAGEVGTPLPGVPRPGDSPTVTAMRSVPNANGTSNADSDMRQTGAGVQVQVNSESGPRWIATTPNLMQTMSAKTGGAWEAWTPQQRQTYLKGGDPTKPVVAAPTGQPSTNQYGTIGATKQAGEAHGPGMVRMEDGKYHEINATTEALRVANDANEKRGVAQANNADVAAQATRIKQDPVSRAIAAEVNKKLGTNVTPESFQRDLTVPVPAAGVVKLPPALPEPGQATAVAGSTPATVPKVGTNRVQLTGMDAPPATVAPPQTNPLSGFKAPNPLALTPPIAPAATPVASIQPGSIDTRPDPYNERRTTPLPGTQPYGTSGDQALKMVTDQIDFSGHGGATPGSTPAPRASYRDQFPPPASIGGQAASAAIPIPLAKPAQQMPIPPATDGFSGNVQTTTPDDPADPANPRRKRSTTAFAGF